MNMMKQERDYSDSPFIVIWEVTRACALKCLHCRAEAQYTADPRQLTFEEGKRLIDQIAELDNPLFVFTGGDPLMRRDLYELIKYAVREKHLSVSMTPSATPRVTKPAIEQAKEAGLSRWAFSLDGSCAEIHDYFRGTKGSFDQTMKGIEWLKELELPIQINTTVSNYNLHDLEAISQKVHEMGTVLWSVFFLVPTGRGMVKDIISAEQHEEVMKWLAELSGRVPYGIKATEAPHYRRVYMQEMKRRRLEPISWTAEAAGNRGRKNTETAEGLNTASPSQVMKREDLLGRAPKGVNDGDGFVFISHIGDVYPSGFLPVVCGNVRERSLGEIYRSSVVMRELRDKSLLKGKCGVCEFKELCGGSRARAYAMTGDYLESDPYCSYIPSSLPKRLTR
ncbi:TIGR04053 family radical SAM/SPASM domain-containing protein [Paenibacillus sp. YPG26]|uniref:TIGR04053 family radical SAM/SPASM domain-containing protein n=1 Tax=Paenibacillus sp. YPG26 TaxID=2878915 RepID=UPI00203E914E|nr:TIGR04053 family radical SAM/SPASM domain-containing protein [Paenibacillus sp. YPG26]USB31729.1 TIGR04053 family radical SAM/SPASM domain-containing protein [Paenibacillus sp. YPG26]